MKRYEVLIIGVLFFLFGCGAGVKSNTKELSFNESGDDVYLVAGQSNAKYCDWGYFEDITGAKAEVIAISGKGIDYLISAAPAWSKSITVPNIKAIIFVHGETDSIIGNENYIDSVEKYRLLLGGYPLLISNVGYYSNELKNKYPNSIFDISKGYPPSNNLYFSTLSI